MSKLQKVGRWGRVDRIANEDAFHALVLQTFSWMLWKSQPLPNIEQEECCQIIENVKWVAELSIIGIRVEAKVNSIVCR